MILVPGVIDNLDGSHASIITKAINTCETRGDAFFVYDAVQHGTTAIPTVTGKVAERDSNYAATYWPWVQIGDSQTGTLRYVPPSVVIPGVFAFNDKVAQPWFAPAGLNRGGIDTAIQAERKLTHANRDDLYESNVNPIATFPGQGVVVFGQKTLQKKSSSLDRVNVRRLLIRVKKFIASSSRFLVFEPNTEATRRRFLNIVNPYLELTTNKNC
jgi:phage tail sheath protein FI